MNARKYFCFVFAVLGALGLSGLGCAVTPAAVLRQQNAGAAAGKLTPTELRCEYMQNPLGVDVTHPRLFWKLQSSMRNQQQTAYQVLVASSTEGLDKDKGDSFDKLSPWDS